MHYATYIGKYIYVCARIHVYVCAYKCNLEKYSIITSRNILLNKREEIFLPCLHYANYTLAAFTYTPASELQTG